LDELIPRSTLLAIPLVGGDPWASTRDRVASRVEWAHGPHMLIEIGVTRSPRKPGSTWNGFRPGGIVWGPAVKKILWLDRPCQGEPPASHPGRLISLDARVLKQSGYGAAEAA
jgi:hypothetical protein